MIYIYNDYRTAGHSALHPGILDGRLLLRRGFFSVRRFRRAGPGYRLVVSGRRRRLCRIRLLRVRRLRVGQLRVRRRTVIRRMVRHRLLAARVIIYRALKLLTGARGGGYGVVHRLQLAAVAQHGCAVITGGGGGGADILQWADHADGGFGALQYRVYKIGG